MWRTFFCFGLCFTGLLPLSARAADKRLSLTGETAAEKLRKALDQVRDLEIADLPLDRAVNQLREQTGINFVIDRPAVPPGPPLGFASNIGLAVNLGGPLSYEHLRLRGQFHGVPLRTALTKLLRDHKLTHVLVGDTVFITTIDKAAERQLGQSVSVNIQDVPLRQELKRLARETGANLVLDPRMVQEGKIALTVRLDEVPLEDGGASAGRRGRAARGAAAQRPVRDQRRRGRRNCANQARPGCPRFPVGACGRTARAVFR